MGILDKIPFLKKKDDFDLGSDFGSDLGLPPSSQNSNFGPPGLPPQHNAHNPPPLGMGNDIGLPSRDLGGMPDDTGFGNMGQSPIPSSVPPGPQAPPGPPGQLSPMQQPFGSPVQTQAPKHPEPSYGNTQLEVVSAKLDSIRYTLESINQRLSSIERVAYGEHEKKRW
jgi:hypothetical protein